LTEHDDVITPLLSGAPRLGLAFSPTRARASPGSGVSVGKREFCFYASNTAKE